MQFEHIIRQVSVRVVGTELGVKKILHAKWAKELRKRGTFYTAYE